MPLSLNALWLSIDIKLIKSNQIKSNDTNKVCQLSLSVKSVSSCHNVRFTIGGPDIETVDSWPYLGHVISCNLNDNLDIEHCYNML